MASPGLPINSAQQPYKESINFPSILGAPCPSVPKKRDLGVDSAQVLQSREEMGHLCPVGEWEVGVREGLTEAGGSPGLEDPLEEGMATHPCILAWRIPIDRGAWWAAVHGVAKSWTRLKRLSSSSRFFSEKK